MNLVAALLAVGLALGVGGAPVPAAPHAGTAPTIALTIQNWGEAVSLGDPKRPAYAYLSAPMTVTAAIDFGRPEPHGFSATLTDRQAFGGVQPAPCSSPAAPVQATCVFEVAVGAGRNVLEIRVSLPGVAEPIVRLGWITGGVLQWSGGVEAMDAAGIWQRIPSGGLSLPALQFTSVRYVVRDVGSLPFRVRGACSTAVVAPGSSIVCPITGPRPVASFAGPYVRVVTLEDPIGTAVRSTLVGAVTSTAAVFRLPTSRVVVGEQVALQAQGLADRDLDLLALRVGSRPLPLDPRSTASRVVFSVPFAPPGATTLDVLQSGVTVARLPIVVTTHPEPPPTPPFPVALIVLVALGGALVALLGWRGLSVLREP